METLIQQLTRDEIESIFALHPNSKCKYSIGKMVKEITVSEFLHLGWLDTDSEEATELILTPISKISDEHAEIMKRDLLKMHGLENKDVYPILVQILHIDVPCGNDLLLRQFEIRELININRQLQLWGYETKLYFGPNHWANGKTAIELGVAIDSTKQ